MSGIGDSKAIHRYTGWLSAGFLIRRSTGRAAVCRGSRSNTESLFVTVRERSTKSSVAARSSASLDPSITWGIAT
jgi:hypothetical protein